MNLTARVTQILPLASGVSGAGNQWQRATIIVEWQDGQYPKKLAISNMKKANEFINLLIGQEYTFSLDVTSREYNGKWYHDVTCYAWQPTAQPQAAPTMPQQPHQAPQQAFPNTQPMQTPPPSYNPQQQPYMPQYPTCAPNTSPF